MSNPLHEMGKALRERRTTTGRVQLTDEEQAEAAAVLDSIRQAREQSYKRLIARNALIRRLAARGVQPASIGRALGNLDRTLVHRIIGGLDPKPPR